LPFVTYYGYCHSLDGATLFCKVDSNKLRINVKYKTTLIDAKFYADLINISEVTSRKTKWPRFFWPTCILQTINFNTFLILYVLGLLTNLFAVTAIVIMYRVRQNKVAP